MRLTNIALLAIKGSGVEVRDQLMKAMGITALNTYYRYIDENHKLLTTAGALAVIRKITGLKDKEILEEETEAVRA